MMFSQRLSSSSGASIVSRTFFDIERWYEVPPFEFTGLEQLPWFLFLGGLAGMLGLAFSSCFA